MEFGEKYQMDFPKYAGGSWGEMTTGGGGGGGVLLDGLKQVLLFES